MIPGSTDNSISVVSILLIVPALLFSIMNQCAADDPGTASIEFFENRIRPIFVDHCIDCHGPDEMSGKLRLDLKSGWQNGGESGPAVVPGDPSASLLIRAVSHQDKQLKMPPPDSAEKLSGQQIRDLTTWIRRGAADPRTGQPVVRPIEAVARDHWAFQPVEAPDNPSGAHPVDFLVDHELHERGFVPTDPADMRTLIRRSVYDLHGLPPTSEQLETPRENFPDLVRQLLNSPRYGERWARHWLDVARYSDARDGVLMFGDDRIRPFAYTYRDYVVDAFNQDLAYDDFVMQQLAADRLELGADKRPLAAMGFLTVGQRFFDTPDILDDRIDVVTRGLLGLTVSCARCHDHKYDPIPTEDYYSLYGVFASSKEPSVLPLLSPPSATEEYAKFEDEFNARVKKLADFVRTKHLARVRSARTRVAEYLLAAQTAIDQPSTEDFMLLSDEDDLNPDMIRRWTVYLQETQKTRDSVFAPWHAFAALSAREFATRGVELAARFLVES